MGRGRDWELGYKGREGLGEEVRDEGKEGGIGVVRKEFGVGRD